jgi:alpha-galactosidase
VVVHAPGSTVPVVTVRRRGWRVHTTVHNPWLVPVVVDEVVLYDGPHGFAADTPVQGESFQMLAQIAGTLGKPEDVGTYPDRSHYRIPEPEDLRTASGFLMLTPPGAPALLLGFGSCHRFNGRIGFDGKRLRISLDTEGLSLAPGETWELEEFLFPSGDDSEELLDNLAGSLRRHHRPRLPKRVPTGWCSWYHYGPDVTAADVAENLDWIAGQVPGLRYIQIDDGYQPNMGDWLETGKAFGGDVRSVLRTIRERGFEPAIWVAPFIADAGSRLFREHPEWFVQGADGKPLPSDRMGFGGWRMGPWYCVDGTHPGAQRHLEAVFRTMRQEWGCTYFKLDANYWGAIHSGIRHDRSASRIEAYRRGMAAVRRGTGDDAILLGCNHPIWGSVGTVDASRSSNDIGRSWESFRDTGRENLMRNWQNGRLWWNDPDCLLLTGDLPEAWFVYHATVLLASGGMVLGGDAMARIPGHRLELLRRLLPVSGVAARFVDASRTVGRIVDGRRVRWVVFNHGDAPSGRMLPIGRTVRLRDVWSGDDLGVVSGSVRLPPLPGRSARLLEEGEA